MTSIVQQRSLSDLDGALAKRLTVPPGTIGLVIDGQGNARTLPPGRHRVVGLLRRLFGRVSDWEFFTLPSDPFPLRVPVPRLRAGDGEWVDVEIHAVFRVKDPARAATALTDAVDLAAALSAALEGPARQAVSGWAAEDVDQPQVAQRMAGLLHPPLEAHAQGAGLALERIVSVTARPSDEAVAVARQMAELDARLAEVEMERRMSELETEAEWRDFVRQLEADFGLPEATVQHSVAASSTEGEPPPSQAAQLRQTVRSYVDGRTAALAARAERLLGRRKPRQPKIVYWWERIVPWLKVISTLILVGSLSVYVFSSKGDLGGRLGAIFELACAMPTAFILFISALWMERRAAQEREEARGGGRLLSLARGDREQIDRLVRRQLAEELAAVKRTLQDTRDQVYREGDRDGAVRIKQVEERADRLRRAVEAKIRGQAVYLTEARVSHDALERMLDYDEQLLAMAADLGDRVAELREAVLADESMGDEVRGLDSDLSTLDHQFQARARFIQTPVRGVEEEN